MGAGIKGQFRAHIQHDALKRGCNGFGCVGQAEPIAVDGIGKNQMQAFRAMFEIVQRLLVCRLCIGVIDAGHQAPDLSGGASDQGFAAFRFAIERVDADGIGGHMDQLFVKIRAFQHGFNTV